MDRNILLLVCTIAAPIFAAQMTGLKTRTLEAMISEEVFAARIDGDKKREQYYRRFMKGALDLADAISQFKASTPKEFHKAIDRAPLATAASAPEFAQHFNSLLQVGADVCQPNEHGNTPLMYASFNNNIWWTMLLLDKGASKNMNTPNSAGVTALTHFYLSCKVDVLTKTLIQVLLCHGAVAVDPKKLSEKLRKHVHAATVAEIQKLAQSIRPIPSSSASSSSTATIPSAVGSASCSSGVGAESSLIKVVN